MVVPKDLIRYLENFSQRPDLSPAINLLVEELKKRFPTLKGVVYYGSCFQEGKELEGLLDLYVLVENYHRTYKNPFLAAANYFLPPNVFYLEKKWKQQFVRSKYAVMALWQFEKAVSPRWFHSYFWGRFCQPVALVWWKDETSARRIIRAFAEAVVTFLLRTAPLAPPQGPLKELWLTGLAYSYRAELRPEAPERLERLWQKFAPHFAQISCLAAKALPFPLEIRETFYRTIISEKERKKAQTLWKIRIVQGKILSVLRLLKASFTFRGGVDYALWKIERHTGKRLEIPPFLRKHPSLALLLWGWKALLVRGVR